MSSCRYFIRIKPASADAGTDSYDSLSTMERFLIAELILHRVFPHHYIRIEVFTPNAAKVEMSNSSRLLFPTLISLQLSTHVW